MDLCARFLILLGYFFESHIGFFKIFKPLVKSTHLIAVVGPKLALHARRIVCGDGSVFLMRMLWVLLNLRLVIGYVFKNATY